MNPSKRNESPSLQVPKTSQNVYKVLRKLEENRKKTQNSSSAAKYSYTPSYTPRTTTYTPTSSTYTPSSSTYSTYVPTYKYTPSYQPTIKSKTAWSDASASTTAPTTTTTPPTTAKTDSRSSSPTPSYTYENYLKKLQKLESTTDSSAVSRTAGSPATTSTTPQTSTLTPTSAPTSTSTTTTTTTAATSRSQTPVITSRPSSSSKPRRSKSVEFGKRTVSEIPVKSSECKFEILNVSNIFNASALKSIDDKLKSSGLFDNYMSLLFVFDSSNSMEYSHYNIYYNKKSQDPDVSTEAIESDKKYFTEEQLRGRSSRRTRKIKESGDETRLKRNKILLKILFLFLVKVMFYAQNNFYFLELTKSIENNIILCGENLPVRKGALFYGNNLFLRKNVSITYASNIDISNYLYQVKQRFIEFVVKLGIVEASSPLQSYPLESLYKEVQESALTQHDNSLTLVLAKYTKFASQ